MDPYSRPVESSTGFTGKSWDWCRRLVARHRVPAVLTGTAVLFGCGMLSAATGHPPVRLTSADFAFAAVAYAAFVAIVVTRRPPWLLVVAGTAAVVVSMAAGTHQVLISPVLLIAVLVFSLPSDLPRVTLGSPAATRGLIARYLTLDDRAPQAPPGLVDALTEREREIVALVATGMSNAEIADHLTLSPLTVKTHANHAMTKLGARDRAQLVVLAYQAGLAGRR